MSDAEEGNNVYKEAFNIACKRNNPTEKQVEAFEKLISHLHEDVVNKIDSFEIGTKGILLIGEDYDLMDGIVSYVWYKHRLVYPISGNDSIRSQIVGADLAGENEDRAWNLLFSKSGLITPGRLHSCIFFLKNTKTEFTDILEKITATIRRIGDKPKVHEEREDIELISCMDNDYEPKVYRRKKGPEFKCMPSIIVVSVKKINKDFSKEFKNKFLMIKIKAKTKKKGKKLQALKENQGKKPNHRNRKEYQDIIDKILKKYNRSREDYPSIDGLAYKIYKKIKEYNEERKKEYEDSGKTGMGEELLFKYKRNSIEKHLQDELLYHEIMEKKNKHGKDE